MPLELQTMLKQAETAARLAGKEALAQMGSARTSIKNKDELVTEADRRCQEIIVESLSKAFPQHGFVGEEGDGGRLFKQPPSGDEDLWWIIDPIDGTNNYAVGIPQFSVSIGALFEGKPVIGVIYDPSTQDLFTGTAAGDSQANGNGCQVRDQRLDRFANLALDSHFGSTMPPWLQDVIVRSRFRNVGSAALHLAYVAKGGYCGFVACTPKLWDLAAGVLLAENAGAIVTDWHNRPLWPLDVHAYEGTPLPFVAATPSVHGELMELMSVVKSTYAK